VGGSDPLDATLGRGGDLLEVAELRVRLSAPQPDAYLAHYLALLASPSLAREFSDT
jgi:hypothetical protein